MLQFGLVVFNRSLLIIFKTKMHPFYPNNVTRQEIWYSRQWSTNCRLVDEDDGQKEGSFDRLIDLVYCGNDNINDKKSLNELLLEGGYAVIYQDFCGISEFSSDVWAQSRGC